MRNKNKVDFADLATAFQYKSTSELKKASFLFSVINNPFLSWVLTQITRFGLYFHLPIKGAIRKTVFSHFCGGESIQDCRTTIDKLGNYQVRTILDFSVEGESTEAGFESTKSEILKIIRESAGAEHIPFTVFKMTGVASIELLKKVQSGRTLLPLEQEAFERIRSRVDIICGEAVAHNIPIMIDAEETWIQNTIDQLVYDMMLKYNHERAYVFNTYQMYRKDSLENLKRDIETMRQNNVYFGAKLVRGAYMEKERDRAEDKGYPSPIHVDKQATDSCFDDGVRFCVENKDKVSLVCGSHNEKSNSLLAELLDEYGLDHNDYRFWFAQLYGMSDNISFNLAKSEYNVAKYVPYGPILSVMPYLFRRAEENTSVAGQSSRELTMIKKELKRRKGEN